MFLCVRCADAETPTGPRPEAVGLEADMPAGRARTVYRPERDGIVRWVAESKTGEGWNRVIDHCDRADAR